MAKINRSIEKTEEQLEGEMKGYSKEKIFEIRNFLHKLLAADDLVWIKHHEGKLSRKEASRLRGGIAVAVEGLSSTR